MSVRWFTPDSARRVLDRAHPIAVNLCRLYSDLEECSRNGPRGEQLVERRYFRRLVEFQICREELRRLGASVRDAKRGRFGFPSRRAGRPVWLCWQVGEGRPRLRLEGDDAAELSGRKGRP